MRTSEDFSRRKFLTGAALAVAGTTAVALAGCTNDSQPETVDASFDKETDVVVIGGGNGGLTAAAVAQQGGKKVTLLEVSGFLGGGSAYSGGILHAMGMETWEDFDTFAEGLYNPVLGKTYVETFRNEYIPWVQDNGIPISRLPGGQYFMNDWKMGSGEPGFLSHKAFFDALAEVVTENGGEILTRIRGLNLITDDVGRVVGVQAKSVDDEKLIRIKASVVVLATGGFQSNKGFMARLVGPYADTVRNIGTPYNNGDGLVMAEAVGALTAGSFTTFSGGVSAWCRIPCVEDDPVLYEEKRAGDPETLPGITDGRPFDPWFSYPTVPESAKAILLNLEGKRYIDESDPIGSKYPRLVQSILEQTRGRVIVVGDQALVDAGRNIADQIKLIEEQKGFVIKADSIEEFAQGLYKAFGVPVANVVRTINEYNNAIATNTASELEVPRLNGQFPLTTPPYYGILAVPGLYNNFGGVAINANAQVLDRHRDPIPGLYAVPPCAGDVMREMYGGGIGAAGTFGYIAGKHISAS